MGILVIGQVSVRWGRVESGNIGVSSHIHGFVAAVSQFIPTVIINRGLWSKSHRIIGFTRSAGFENYILDPHYASDLIKRIDKFWNNRGVIKNTLKLKIPKVQEQAHDCFNSLLKLF